LKEIAPNVYVESKYQGVTVGAIVTGEGVICIDSPMLPAEARDWRARIAKLTDEPVRYLIYTDAHRDRILGGQYLGGVVIAHDIAGEAMQGHGDAFRQQASDFLSRREPEAAMEVVTNLHVISPQVTFNRQLVLYSGSTQLVLQHVGGATPCNSWVILPEHDLLFAGDVVTVKTHPSLIEANVDHWIDVLRKFDRKNPPAEFIIPGRGGTRANARDFKELLAYLRLARRRIKALVRRDRPRSEINKIVQDLLPLYPIPDQERERIQRRVKSGLERVYDFYVKAADGDSTA